MPRNRPRPQHPQTCRGTPASQASPVVRAAVPHRTTTEGRTIAKSVHLKHTIRTEVTKIILAHNWEAKSHKLQGPHSNGTATYDCCTGCTMLKMYDQAKHCLCPLAKALGPVQGCIHVEEWRLFLTYTKALYELASH